jgi:hypothetical protein
MNGRRWPRRVRRLGRFPASDRHSFDYTTTFVDYITKLWYGFASSLMRGRLLETILKAERGVASRGCGS